jgi:hypothetical protein
MERVRLFDRRSWWAQVAARRFSPETLSVAEAVGGNLDEITGRSLLGYDVLVALVVCETELTEEDVGLAFADLARAGLFELCGCDECRRAEKGPTVDYEFADWLASPAGRFAEYLALRGRPRLEASGQPNELPAPHPPALGSSYPPSAQLRSSRSGMSSWSSDHSA